MLRLYFIGRHAYVTYYNIRQRGTHDLLYGREFGRHLMSLYIWVLLNCREGCLFGKLLPVMISSQFNVTLLGECGCDLPDLLLRGYFCRITGGQCTARLSLRSRLYTDGHGQLRTVYTRVDAHWRSNFIHGAVLVFSYLFTSRCMTCKRIIRDTRSFIWRNGGLAVGISTGPLV